MPPEIVHEPCGPGLSSLGKDIADAWRHRAFTVALAAAEQRVRTRRTRLGALWLLGNPLLLAGVYFLVVGVLTDGARGTPAYLGQLIGGLLLYHLTRDALAGGARSVVGNPLLVTSTTLPRTVLPLAAVVASARTVPGVLGTYAVVHVLTGLPVGLHLAWVVPLLAVQALLTVGLALLLAAWAVTSRDLLQALPYVLRVGVYLTPILYRTEEVQARLAAAVGEGWGWLVHLNPLSGLFAAHHAVLLDGRSPAAGDLGVALAWALAALLAGALVFLRAQRGFALAA